MKLLFIINKRWLVHTFSAECKIDQGEGRTLRKPVGFFDEGLLHYFEVTDHDHVHAGSEAEVENTPELSGPFLQEGPHVDAQAEQVSEDRETGRGRRERNVAELGRDILPFGNNPPYGEEQGCEY